MTFNETIDEIMKEIRSNCFYENPRVRRVIREGDVLHIIDKYKEENNMKESKIQCEKCNHRDVCAYRELFEKVIEAYETAKRGFGKSPWFKATFECNLYIAEERND